MTYDASGIQQEGRFLHIGEEEASSATECGQGTGKEDGSKPQKSRRKNTTIAVIADKTGYSARHVVSLLNIGMPKDVELARQWLDERGEKKTSADWKKGEWQFLWMKDYVNHEIKLHSKKKIYPDWSSIAGKYLANKKIRSKPTSRAFQIYRQHWKAEINSHKLNRIFPDWRSLIPPKDNRDPKQRYAKRRNQQLKYKKEYVRRDYVRARNAQLAREKCRNDPSYKVKKNLSRRLHEIMKGIGLTKGASILKYIGCSQKELRRCIESQFVNSMSWENHGTYWHVDHILPCSSFDHNDPRQVAQCWHWTNLRPLEARKNMAKSDSITEPQMQLLLCTTH